MLKKSYPKEYVKLTIHINFRNMIYLFLYIIFLPTIEKTFTTLKQLFLQYDKTM